MSKTRKQYPENFRTTFGFSTMMWPVAAAATFVTSFFMQYLTDYSGIDQALGKPGFAAAFGTIILLVARIVDIVDDPLQAYIIDNAKEGKLGKYRKFAFANIILVSLAIICIFSIPQGIKSNSVMLCIWVGVFYLMYEFGTAFNTAPPLMQKTSYDTKLRTKWTQMQRIWLVVILVPVYFYIPIVTVVDQSVGNMGRSFSMVCMGMMLVLGIVAFIGVLGMKEKPDKESINGGEKKESLKIREIASMFAKNKPLLVHAIAYFLSNMVFSLSTAINLYFLKWYYSANLLTGVVDNIKFAEISGIYAISGLLPNFIAPFIAGRVVKKCGTYSRATSFCLTLAVGVYTVLTVLFFTGILASSPFIFIGLNFLSAIAIGTAVVPQTLLWTEGADYAEYKTGKKMNAMVNSVNSVLNKALSAIATVLTGSILIAVGYSMDNVTGNYAGDVSSLPQVVQGLGFFITAVPIIVMLGAVFLYKLAYPITPDIQKEMIKALSARRESAAATNEE